MQQIGTSQQIIEHRRSFLGAAALAFAAAQLGALGSVAAQSNNERPSSYLAENDRAMKKMMADMAVRPSGDVDRDFVAMMVPHHQGAIDMAVAVLRYGHNAQVKRLAQEIIVTQQEEIAAMRLAVGDPLPALRASPTQPQPPQAAAMPAGMKMK